MNNLNIPMNPEVKEKWIKALRSGDYKQAIGGLRFGDGYCCLGVLCDIHSKESNHSWDSSKKNPDLFKYLEGGSVLPAEVMGWSGLKTPNGFFSIETNDIKRTINKLSRLNDGGKSFKEIADIIEKYF